MVSGEVGGMRLGSELRELESLGRQLVVEVGSIKCNVYCPNHSFTLRFLLAILIFQRVCGRGSTFYILIKKWQGSSDGADTAAMASRGRKKREPAVKPNS